MAAKAPLSADPATRPGVTGTAGWLAVATAVSSLLLNGFALLTGDAASAAQDSLVADGMTLAAARNAVLTTAVAETVVFVVYSALLVLFARRMRAGRPRARVVVTVLCAISLLSVVGLGPGSITGVLAAFTIVLAWLPASSDWFRSATRRAA